MYSWDNAQVVLVGNKCDLEQDRAVTQERGQRLADQLGKFSFCIYIYLYWMYALIVRFFWDNLLVSCIVLCFKGFYR
jgi:GTPase SAR1 family protein